MTKAVAPMIPICSGVRRFRISADDARGGEVPLSSTRSIPTLSSRRAGLPGGSPGSADRDSPWATCAMNGNLHLDADFAGRLRSHQVQIFGYIYSLVRNFDDDDDLFQQTSLAMWNKYDKYDPGRSFVAWACVVARFEVSNFVRARSRQRPLQRRPEPAADRRAGITGAGPGPGASRGPGRVHQETEEARSATRRGLLRGGVAGARGGQGVGAVVAEHPQLAPEDPPVALRVCATVDGSR